MEDPENPAIAVVAKTVEINRQFTLEDGVRERKQKALPWRQWRIDPKKPPKVVYDKTDPRFKRWRGWKLVFELEERPLKEGDKPQIHYDAVYLYRGVLKNGKWFMVEIYAHWPKDKKLTKSFDQQIDLLLKGLRF